MYKPHQYNMVVKCLNRISFLLHLCRAAIFTSKAHMTIHMYVATCLNKWLLAAFSAWPEHSQGSWGERGFAIANIFQYVRLLSCNSLLHVQTCKTFRGNMQEGAVRAGSVARYVVCNVRGKSAYSGVYSPCSCMASSCRCGCTCRGVEAPGKVCRSVT